MGKDLKGKNLGKGISQRKDGRYEARAVVNGIKIDIYDVKLSTLKERFEAEISKYESSSKHYRPDMMLSEWYDEWFTKSKSATLKNDASRRSYYKRCKNTFISNMPSKMFDITQMMIQSTSNYLIESGYAKKTVSDGLSVLRECLECAVLNGIIKANPCIGIKVRDDNIDSERRVLTQEEQDEFLSFASGRYYYELYAILLSTGMRVGELSGLQWKDIDFKNKEIHIRRSLSTVYDNGKKSEELCPPKTQNSYRDIPFFDNVENLFRSWKKKQDACKKRLGKDRWRVEDKLGDLVFTSSLGSPATRYVIARDINNIVKDINANERICAEMEGRDPVEFDHLHPHAFRHTFATRCFEKGLDPLFIQKIMGHANYDTTVSYTHVLKDVMQREVRKAESFV